MLAEDLATSDSLQVDLVLQREDLESFHESLSLQFPDLQTFRSRFNGQLDMSHLLEEIVYSKQRRLLTDLIRELQQYILSMSAGTTDTSVMQSDELEDIDCNISLQKISHEEAVEAIVEFASRKLDLSLCKEALMGKLDRVREEIDAEEAAEKIQKIQTAEDQMRTIDQRIKVVSNRCQNELRPRLKALGIS